jgi:hypothetical protein
MTTTYYVSATGNDANDGLTDATPFQTLAQAVDMAKQGSIKTITVIGTLDAASEANASETLPKDPAEPDDLAKVKQYIGVIPGIPSKGKSGSIFYIKDSGKDEILITGCDNAMLQGVAGNEINISSLDGNTWQTERNMRVLHISGVSNIRLENIIITAGAVHGIERSNLLGMITTSPLVLQRGKFFYPPNGHGGGMLVSDGAKVLLGNDTIVCKNIAIGGGGIAVTKGTLEINGGTVRENKAERGGGIYISENSTINMRSGNISNNIVFGKLKTVQWAPCVLFNEQSTGLGGGVYADRNSIFNMSAGIIENNTVQANEEKKSKSHLIGMSINEVSKKTGLRGGGIYVDGGTFKMTNGIVSNNKAQKGKDLCYTKDSAFGQGSGTIRDKAKVEK